MLKEVDHNSSLCISERLKNYLENKFLVKKNVTSPFFDEIDLEYWRGISTRVSQGKMVFNELKKCYPQLNFPIQLGIEKTEFYKDIVLRGKTVDMNFPFLLHLNDFENNYSLSRSFHL